jgi:hypothetical protein
MTVGVPRHGSWVARFVQIACTYAFARWWLAQDDLRTRRRIRIRCELREQRLEEADAPTMRLDSLHSLAYVAFTAAERERVEIDPLLDQLTELVLQRRWYAAHVHDAPPRVRARWDARLRVLDDEIGDLDALIRLYCERAIYARCG